ncbi:MAG TPA: DUF1572 family protein [Trueperaceae bacterium]|nr:DUF1572 family protein [Trueperaceae bacterium]
MPAAVDMSDANVGTLFLRELRKGFARQKAQAERVFAQLEAPEWHARLDAGANSVAVLARHLAGNLRSRYTDFLTTDGEKPDRDRDGEFTSTSLAPAEILAEWDAGWEALLSATASLTSDDLWLTVTIRGEEKGVLEALLATFDHNAHHVGQIVMLGKHLRGERWQYLSIPPRR